MANTRSKASEKSKPVAEPAQEPPKKKVKAVKEDVEEEKPTSKLSVGTQLKEGQFVFNNEQGETVDLFKASAEKGLIIFFYPKANTPGCTKQGCGFRDNYSQIQKAGFDVYGCSADSEKSQSNWKTKQSFPYHLLTDDKRVLIKAIGAHKAPSSIKRSHIIIGKGGKVLDMQIQVSPGDSVDKATEFVSKL